MGELQAAIKSDQALIDAANVQLSYTRLTSPINGVVGIRQIDVGNIISPSNTNGLVVVTQLHPISLIFTLPETNLPQIQQQQQKTKTPLTVLAYNQDDTIKLDQGVLGLVNNEILQTTGSIQLKANFDNKANKLWPGELVNARLLVDTRHNGLTVPASVVQQGPKGPYAYVVNPDSTVAIRQIKVAQISDGQALDRFRPQGQRAGRGRRPIQAAAGHPCHGRCTARRHRKQPHKRTAGADPMNISAPFIRRPIATALIMVGLLVGGLVAYPLLPVASLPNVNYPTLSVTAQLPGADPQTMASTVASPLELQFGEIPGLTQMTSSSALGYTQITLQFELSRPIDGAVSDTLSAINAATAYLPKNMPYPPMIRKVNPADTPILVLGITSDSLPLTVVDAYAQNILLQKISQISGVGLVGIGGEQQPTVRVQVDPEALAARGINLEDVRTVLGQANVDLPKGTLNSPRQTYTLNTNDQLFKPDTIRRSGHRLSQRIAGPHPRYRPRHQRGGERADRRLVQQEARDHPGDPAPARRQRHRDRGADQGDDAGAQASIPAAVKVDVISDRTQTIRASVADVQFTLLLTVALVVMVIFIFLRNFWATVIPAVTVPLSLVGTFAVLYEMGYSLDNLSLMALVDRGRLRGRRRRRRDREHRTAYGGGPLAVRRGDEGVRRDRLHRHGDHVLADRRVHSVVPDERLCRIAVPRVRGHGERGARSLAGDLADAHADDVRVPAQAGEQGARMALPGVRARLRWPAPHL